MKHFTDKHKRDIIVDVGDLVLVKLCPYRQSSMKDELFSKLAKPFYGPFQVLQRIGTMAYKLQLPEGSHIHPVFHCSLLRPFQSSSSTPEPAIELPPTSVDNQLEIISVAFLTTLWDHHSDVPKLFVLVQWKGLSLDDTTC